VGDRSGGGEAREKKTKESETRSARLPLAGDLRGLPPALSALPAYPTPPYPTVLYSTPAPPACACASHCPTRSYPKSQPCQAYLGIIGPARRAALTPGCQNHVTPPIPADPAELTHALGAWSLRVFANLQARPPGTPLGLGTCPSPPCPETTARWCGIASARLRPSHKSISVLSRIDRVPLPWLIQGICQSSASPC